MLLTIWHSVCCITELFPVIVDSHDADLILAGQLGPLGLTLREQTIKEPSEADQAPAPAFLAEEEQYPSLLSAKWSRLAVWT